MKNVLLRWLAVTAGIFTFAYLLAAFAENSFILGQQARVVVVIIVGVTSLAAFALIAAAYTGDFEE